MTIKAGEHARVSVCRFGFVQVGLCPAILTVSRANRKLGDTFKLTGNAQFADSVMEFHFFVVTCRPWNAP
jgi:hypothetical protein